jgi:hypothetical protein
MPDFRNLDPEQDDGDIPDPDPATPTVEDPSRGIGDMLLSTSPSPSLETVDDPWDPDRGGTSRIMRGCMKAFDVDGMPAIADIGIGIVEIVVDVNDSDDTPGDGLDSDIQIRDG